MFTLFVILAAIAAAVHVVAFGLEAILFPQRSTYRRFGVRTDEEMRTLRTVMVNQGFYNLFLAIGFIAGIFLAGSGRCALAYFCCLFATGCGLVLVLTKREMWRPALLQSAPPLLAAIALFIANRA